ncbi:PREDICTED: transmembrane protein 164 [Wasmannia auropunctata]|uniref:transmembrane protein 164 n=1 Tax=Wasmannia auropunctata TaxID=64793 RepID=UPI0005EE8BC6|nr:PREDICTED: transmembrane protein 164 [Wasmannia auropunctata]XP_011693357.1 PREDICTED: transmembrane protein 164 [Wasmannia auropunctata]XP_011693358.1 PREDICTED: transmembrane protein 164 [Wasmannia auropunctata]XP_011693359.1 PREDICTED: transmembrane protein 164 [Wasmannia auropunctata]XP_011693360.1 PREDICTED: transmembrane protein 164 [Wasmannia auropunctata]
MFEWAYDGVNSSIPRNVGPECANYLTLKRRIIETLFISVFIISFIVWGLKRVTLPRKLAYVGQDRVGRRVLLIVMSLVLGMEIGFKFTSRTVIYLLNPCHITTALQLYLLAADPSPTVTAIFRIHLNLLNGPVLAYLFPETESRIIFADKAMYYIQHGLMLVIPYYLLRIGGVYNIEPLSDMSWSILSYGLNAGYHFWILQSVALPVQVNLSHMLCAAVLDPFEGQNYRIWAVTHQLILCPILCKLFCYGSNFFLTKFPLTRVKPSLECAIPKKNCTYEQNEKLHEESNTSGNGHTHFD